MTVGKLQAAYLGFTIAGGERKPGDKGVWGGVGGQRLDWLPTKASRAAAGSPASGAIPRGFVGRARRRKGAFLGHPRGRGQATEGIWIRPARTKAQTKQVWRGGSFLSPNARLVTVLARPHDAASKVHAKGPMTLLLKGQPIAREKAILPYTDTMLAAFKRAMDKAGDLTKAKL